ncbi:MULTISPECIES: PIN domain-containing protein [Limnospira]|uniref:PIN domain-containing protein n=1 Tax=Limnospira fusiformis PMC 851.14 TaxID=2219512 RepID=A0ABU9EJN3_LIMFS|nr:MULTISPECIES: PIN domain-containing protein [unclassified Limnospira]MDT9190580.1 PIN domain-containing protein [Limnospira sp. PMC 894.15]MDT9236541.1 PIN domain-containing protein [Limnospira sp. PMC 917.15]MDT9277663.1 PIN domain-containing protein [Limnospira sp. PMC 737.11]UWU47761.1 putative nucleic acid-binding protein, contains PIN domain [Arthrospira platensis C1]
MSDKALFIDSNIWLYRFLANQDSNPQEDARKRQIAVSLTNQEGIVVSTQVINEICSVLKRKVNFDETQISQLIEEFEQQCQVIDVTTSILKKASQLRMNYNLSFWDGLIVASALSSNANILYSEDMQDGLIVESQLTIINPFRI